MATPTIATSRRITAPKPSSHKLDEFTPGRARCAPAETPIPYCSRQRCPKTPTTVKGPPNHAPHGPPPPPPPTEVHHRAPPAACVDPPPQPTFPGTAHRTTRQDALHRPPQRQPEPDTHPRRPSRPFRPRLEHAWFTPDHPHRGPWRELPCAPLRAAHTTAFRRTGHSVQRESRTTPPGTPTSPPEQPEHPTTRRPPPPLTTDDTSPASRPQRPSHTPVPPSPLLR